MNNQKLQTKLEEALSGKHDGMFADVLSKIHCMSRARVYAVLNAVVSSMDYDDLYLEVGTYQGGSLISALLGNEARAIGVDNFNEFKETNTYERTQSNLEAFGVGDRAVLRSMSYQEFFASVPADFKVAVYYYDGQHDYPGQLAGMEAAWHHLRPGSMILVDDYIYPEVSQAVNQFVANYIHQVQFQFVMLPTEGLDETWWNGVVVLKVV